MGGKTLRFRRAVLATGARAHRPTTPGLAEAGFLTNETVFALTELPRRLAVIGAGPIGCELAQAFARFGSHVTILGKHPRILPKEDPEAADRVETALRRDGITFTLGCEVTRVEVRGADKVLHLKCGETTRELAVDEILVGAGRVPNVDGLNLEGIGVEFDAHDGVTVDDRLRTTNARVYAAGDVCSKYKFTHAADAMARVVIRNALFKGRSKASALTIPWCTYTAPEIAHVGLYEHEAKEKGIAYRAFTQELNQVDRGGFGRRGRGVREGTRPPQEGRHPRGDGRGGARRRFDFGSHAGDGREPRAGHDRRGHPPRTRRRARRSKRSGTTSTAPG